MNRQQYVALKHHCRLAGECTHPRFVYLQAPHISVVLTVNSGYE